MSNIPNGNEVADKLWNDPRTCAEVFEGEMFAYHFLSPDSGYSDAEKERYTGLLLEFSDGSVTETDMQTAQQVAAEVLKALGLTPIDLSPRVYAEIVGKIAAPIMFTRIKSIIDHERQRCASADDAED